MDFCVWCLSIRIVFKLVGIMHSPFRGLIIDHCADIVYFVFICGFLLKNKRVLLPRAPGYALFQSHSLKMTLLPKPGGGMRAQVASLLLGLGDISVPQSSLNKTWILSAGTCSGSHQGGAVWWATAPTSCVPISFPSVSMVATMKIEI